jgi:hypothetical protein
MGVPLCHNTCVQVGVIFKKNGVRLSLNDVVVSWLRLHTPTDSIPHPFHMYAMSFSTLISCRWRYGSTLTLLFVQMGGDFMKIYIGPHPSDVVKVIVEAPTPL